MILDTDILVALLKADPEATKAIEKLQHAKEQIATTVLTAYELLRGAQVSLNQQQNLAAVKELLSNIEVLDLTIQSCNEAAKIYENLRKKGKTIGEIDNLIAAIAKSNSEKVMTRNKHFSFIQELHTAKW